LEEICKMGKAKSIGVSNFNQQQLKDVLDVCKIKPAVQQIEIHPYCQNKEMIEFCHSNDIVVIAYCPLGAADRPW
jgi:diketogulonate reductase-like aldo/keto reductase